MKVCSVCDRCFDDVEFYCSEAGHPPLESTHPGTPEMLDGYRLDAVISSGLTGDVYRAYHVASGRPCRVRFPSVDAKSREAFLRDADLAAAMFHPNLVDIYEAGSIETGKCYVVAEDPSGQSLRHLLADVGVPSLLTSIQVVRQAAEAVHALHLKGLTHGSLCPENIVLSSDAEHRLLVRIQNPDLGGAGQTAVVFNKFFIDSAVDSLRYFAPEQCSGEPAGNKADVYSLGIILFEMLAGTPPFEATTAAALIEKHKNQRPPDIRIDNFDLRMLLAHTLMESLSKRPERRQSSANAFARQMRHIEQLATHVSTPPPVISSAPTLRPSVSAPATRKIAPLEEADPFVNATQSGIEYAGELEFSSDPPAVQEKAQTVPSVHIEEMPTLSEREFATLADEQNECRESVPGPIELDPVPMEAAPEPVVVNAEPEKIIPEKPAPSRLKLHRNKLHSRILQENAEERNARPLDPSNGDAGQAIRANVETAASREPSTPSDHAVAATIPARPIRIEWEQPEDDIPSVADVQEVLSSEGINVPPVSEPVPAIEETTFPTASEPVPEGARTCAPSTPETILARERMTVSTAPEREPAIVARPLPKRKDTPQKAVMPAARPPVVAKTARPAKLAGGSVPSTREVAVKAALKPSREAVFFPTILGNVEKSDVFVPDTSGEILSAYNSASAARFAIPNRRLMIASGLLVFVVLLLFGTSSIGRLVSIETSGDSVAAKSAAATSAQPETVPAEAATGAPTAARPVQETRAEDKVPPMHTEAKDPAATRTNEPRRASARQSERKTPAPTVSPSVGDKREQKQNAVPTEKREQKQNTVPAGKAPRANPIKVAGATRPRIVKVAEP